MYVSVPVRVVMAHVVMSCQRAKVRWLDAPTLTANMVDLVTGRDLADVDDVARAVRQQPFAADSEPRIAGVGSRAYPSQMFAISDGQCGETFGQRLGWQTGLDRSVEGNRISRTQANGVGLTHRRGGLQMIGSGPFTVRCHAGELAPHLSIVA